VLNEKFQEIKRVRLLPYNGRTTSDPSAIDSHEFIYLDDNHFITLSYFQKPVSNIPASLNPVPNCKVVAPIIQEVLNDAVVFEWDGTNYPEFYRQSLESNAFSNANVVHDYIHMNSIFIDPADNNLICSLRHTDQVIKISRTDGHIIWRLGGTNSNFPLTADMTFIRQHNATLTDDNKTLLLFDNGDTAIRRTTRIMEFRFNTEQSAITSYKAFSLPQNIFVQYTGSVQKRGETYFICCGSIPKILEVNYLTNKVTFLMNVQKSCYRVFKD
jgi:arylsulfate sulfotransferase